LSAWLHGTPTAHLFLLPTGDFGDTVVQGALVHQLRYLASVVTQNFSAFGELLAMPKRFAEISGGCWVVLNKPSVDSVAGPIMLAKAGMQEQGIQPA
jgi:hypothetical protein